MYCTLWQGKIVLAALPTRSFQRSGLCLACGREIVVHLRI